MKEFFTTQNKKQLILSGVFIPFALYGSIMEGFAVGVGLTFFIYLPAMFGLED